MDEDDGDLELSEVSLKQLMANLASNQQSPPMFLQVKTDDDRILSIVVTGIQVVNRSSVGAGTGVPRPRLSHPDYAVEAWTLEYLEGEQHPRVVELTMLFETYPYKGSLPGILRVSRKSHGAN